MRAEQEARAAGPGDILPFAAPWRTWTAGRVGRAWKRAGGPTRRSSVGALRPHRRAARPSTTHAHTHTHGNMAETPGEARRRCEVELEVVQSRANPHHPNRAHELLPATRLGRLKRRRRRRRRR